jgi:hypothetical protein
LDLQQIYIGLSAISTHLGSVIGFVYVCNKNFIWTPWLEASCKDLFHKPAKLLKVKAPIQRGSGKTREE